jgi:S1-C subfamily serine protease
VNVLRDGKEKAFKVKVGNLDERAEATIELIPGVTIKTLDEELRTQFKLDRRVETGVVVTEVNESSPYANILVPGVVIVEINRRAVTDVPSASAALRPGLNALLVQYRGVMRYLTLNMK